MSKEWGPSNVLDILGCGVAREILALASAGPITAKEIAAHCGVSPPTVYRRITALEEYGLIDHRLRIDIDGHHCKQFVTDLAEIRVTVDDGALDVDVDSGTDYTDKFTDFWQDLETGSSEPATGSRPPRSEPSSFDISSS